MVAAVLATIIICETLVIIAMSGHIDYLEEAHKEQLRRLRWESRSER